MEYFIRYSFAQKKKKFARKNYIYNVENLFTGQYRDISGRSARNINSDQEKKSCDFDRDPAEKYQIILYAFT